MKNFNKKFLVLFVLIFSVFLTQINVYVEGGVDKTALIKSEGEFELTITQDGYPGSGPYDSSKPIIVDGNFKVPVISDVENPNINPNDSSTFIQYDDYAEFKVSDDFHVIGGAVIPLVTSNGITIGNLKIVGVGEDRKARLEFFGDDVPNDIFEEGAEMSGGFTLNLKLDESFTGDENGQSDLILFDKTFTFKTPDLEENTNINKSGTFNRETGEIEWTIVLTRTSHLPGTSMYNDLDLAGFTFSDNLANVGEYVVDSFSVKGNPVTPTYEEGVLSYVLADNSISTQTIKFKTKVSNDKLYGNGNQSVYNKAGLSKDEINIFADHTVNFTNTWIDKSGAAGDFTVDEHGKPHQEITWSIEANHFANSLNNVVITDVLPDGLTWKSAKVYVWDATSEDWVLDTAYPFTNEPTNGIYNLGNRDTKIKLEIVSVVDFNNFEASTSNFNNTATVSWDGMAVGNDGYGDSSGNIGVGYNSISKKGTINKANQSVKWNVTVDTRNQNNFPTGLKVYDLLVYGSSIPTYVEPSGLEISLNSLSPQFNQKYVAGSFTRPATDLEVVTILNDDNEAVADLLIVTLNGFDTGTTKYTYAFDTQIINPDITLSNTEKDVKNTVSLYNGSTKLNDSTAIVKYKNNLLAKEMLHRDAHNDLLDADLRKDAANEKATDLNDGYNYNDHSVIYRLLINKDAIDVDNVIVDENNTLAGKTTVVDTLPLGWEFDELDGKDYLIFEADASGDATTLVADTSALLAHVISTNTDGNETITFNFNTLNKAYVILLKARVSNETLNDYFDGNKTTTKTNTATLATDNYNPGVSDTQDVNIVSKVLDKNMVTPDDDGIMSWTVEFNPYKLTDAFVAMPKLYITDTISEGVELLRDASGNLILDGLKVYTLSLNTDGTLANPVEVTLDENQDYFIYDPLTRELKLDIKDKSQAYRFTYKAEVVGSNGDVITNTVKLMGTEKDVTAESDQYVVAEQDGWATMQKRGIVRINKTDGNKPLALVEFTLYDKTGETALRVAYTNFDGSITLRGLVEGEYILKETKAPEGFVEHPIVYNIKVEIVNDEVKTTINNEELANNQINIVNFKEGSRGHIKVSKKLAGNAANKNDEFTFTLTLDPAVDEDYTYVNENNEILGTIGNNGTFTLKGDETITILNIPKETAYAIVEADFEGYVSAAVNDSGDVIVDQTVLVEFTNTKNNKVVISKTNANQQLVDGAIFKVEVLDEGEYVDFKDNLVVVDGKITLEAVDVGTYRLSETDASDGYLLNTEPVVFEVVKDEDDVTLDVNVTFINYKGSVKLNKVDENGIALENVIFDLYKGDELIFEGLTTNEEGVIEVFDLAVGAYHFVEISNPNGHVVDSRVVEFSIVSSASNEPQQVVITKSNALASVEFIKYDELDETLEGVEFMLYLKDGDDLKEYASVTSDEDGRVYVDGLVVGDYVFKETATIDGYILNSRTVEFSINETSDLDKVSVVLDDYVNYKGSVKLVKFDEYEEVLADVVFNLYTADGEIYLSGLHTDENGELIVSNLAVGDYYFVEVSNESGHVVNTVHREFSIVEEAFDAPEVVVVELINTKARVEFSKLDTNGDPLSNIEFTLYELRDEALVEVDKVLSNEDGLVIFEDVSVGDYVIRESATNDTHILNTTEVSFSVLRTSEVDKVIIVLDDYINYLGSVKLHKIDEYANDLEGVIYDLYKGEQLVYENLVTDEFGLIEVNDLAVGDYYFVEVSNPHGHVVDSRHLEFNIVDTYEGEPIQVVLTASNAFGAVEFNKVDKNDNPIKDAVFMLYLIDEDLELVEYATATSDELGRVFVDGLVVGNYVFKEVAAAEGYVLNTTSIPFVIDEKTEEDKVVIVLDDFVNYQGELEINKVDKEDRLIDGAIFEVLDSKGVVIAEFSVNKGVHTLEGLAPGTYTLREKTAPKGFKLSRETYDFTVVEEFEGELETIVIKVVNEKIVKVPGTGIAGGTYYYLAIILIAIMILSLNTYQYTKRKYNK